MKSTAIKFIWVESGFKHQKDVNREDIYNMFKGLSNIFSDDNVISEKMINDILPYADKIFINKDFNETQNIPILVYYINDDKKILNIIRYHKVVWSILDRICAE